MVVSLVYENDNLNTFKLNWYKHGLTMVDFTAAIILLWSHIIMTFGFLKVFRSSAKPISKLCQLLSVQNETLGVTETQMRNITKRSYIAVTIMYTIYIGSISASYPYCKEMLAEQVRMAGLAEEFCFVWLYTVFIFFWPFPAIASFIINRQCIMALVLQMEVYNDKVPLKGMFYQTLNI
jgi:hypothetical protein